MAEHNKHEWYEDIVKQYEDMLHYNKHSWYLDVMMFTEELVNFRTVSPSTDENIWGSILGLLSKDSCQYTQIGIDAIEGDLYERQNTYAFLQGQSSKTLVLLGHIDTVGTGDYGTLEESSLSPHALAQKREELGTTLEGIAANDWMFGRGSVDMKSGVAVNIALMRYFASQPTPPPLSLLFLATPDEENESAGVLQAVRFLTRMREQYELTYVGAINTDYTTAQYPGDPHRYIFNGTIGKLLPSFLCIGRESHVGTPFNGLDANLLSAELVSNLSMNDELCDVQHGQVTAPPVTLKATDLKTHYNVQLPSAAYFYLNVLTFTTTPDALLLRLRQFAESALATVLARVDKTEARWRSTSNQHQFTVSARTGDVLTYAELYSEVLERSGAQQVQTELDTVWESLPTTIDTRERSLHLVYKLWTLSGRQGPAIVLYYSPPYYPHVAATKDALHDALNSVIAAYPEVPLVQQEYYPYLSDLSYLRLDAGIDTFALKANMPVWKQPTDEGKKVGSYYLPLEAIEKLNIPVVDFGPYGQGAHQRNEAVVMSYSFETLPQLIYETIEELARRL
jgi:arginine utilization protein RocB